MYKSILKLSIVVMGIAIFVGYIGFNLYILLSIATGLAILACVIKRKRIADIKISRNDIIWIICIMISIICSTYSMDLSGSINFTFMLFCCWILKIVYQNSEIEFLEYIEKAFLFFSAIHVVITLLYLIIPNSVLALCTTILPSSLLSTSMELYNNNAIPGIAGQTGTNAYFISIFLAIQFCEFLSKHKRKNLIFFLLGLVALFLTAKRGLLVANIISIMAIIIINLKNNKKVLKNTIVCSIVLFVVYFVVVNTASNNPTIQKFVNLGETDDITNGRSDLWNASIDVFKENKLMGVGMNATYKIIGDATHNIYIQLLSDSGIIGGITFYCAFIYSIIVAIKSIKYRNKENKYDKGESIQLIGIYIQLLFLIYGFSGNPLYSTIFITPYMMSLAFIEYFINSKKGEKNEERNFNIS